MRKVTKQFETKKSLGQNFLNNKRVPERMAEAGSVHEGDIVLEIGPGTGALTATLLERGAHVVAVEADPRAIDVLRDTFAEALVHERLTLVHGDARKLDLKALGLRPRGYKVVANIPYYLSGLLFRTLLETDIQPHTLVFLVQREVALRIARDPKESLLSLSVKVFGDPEYVETVKKGNFTPQPKVDSAIIAIKHISTERLEGIPVTFFFTLIHEAFKSKRKQLVGNLKSIVSESVILSTLQKHALPVTVRAEDIPLHTWIAIAQDLFPHASVEKT